MKDPKALFPFLFASSWLGNLLLTVLAFYLAFTHEGPLSPLLFATVALCILSGNMLPIIVYAVSIRIRKLELEADSTEVTWRVQEGLKRSEDVMNRLDEAEGALAKSVLVVRQVPERIRETMETVNELAEKINVAEMGTFAESISEQGKSLDSVKASVADLSKVVSTAEADIGVIGKDIKSIVNSQSRLVEKISEPPGKKKKDELEVSVVERLDLLFESLENIQDSLDGLLQRIASIETNRVSQASVENPAEDTQDELGITEDDPSVDETEEDSADGPEEDADLEEISKPAVEKTAEDDKSVPEEIAAPDDEEEEFQLTDGRTRLIAHAMIGMQNKLYIRGDHPWLSWEDGQQMELIGIGEFAWSIDDLKEPIEVTVLMNDEYAAVQGTIVLNPGKTVRIKPTFPKI